ncbi:hypothetical protein [Calothrix sp. FACHB-1219]
MLTKLAIAATNHLEMVRCANTTTQPQKIFYQLRNYIERNS